MRLESPAIQAFGDCDHRAPASILPDSGFRRREAQRLSRKSALKLVVSDCWSQRPSPGSGPDRSLINATTLHRAGAAVAGFAPKPDVPRIVG